MLQHLWDIGSILSDIPKCKQGKHKLGKIGRYVIGWKELTNSLGFRRHIEWCWNNWVGSQYCRAGSQTEQIQRSDVPVKRQTLFTCIGLEGFQKSSSGLINIKDAWFWEGACKLGHCSLRRDWPENKGKKDKWIEKIESMWSGTAWTENCLQKHTFREGRNKLFRFKELINVSRQNAPAPELLLYSVYCPVFIWDLTDYFSQFWKCRPRR